jgi:predicted secreted Zn-dependent protease
MNQDPQPVTWRKSSASAQGNCVEVAAAGESILVRDTKNRSGTVLTFTASEWQAFVTGVNAGEFNLNLLRSQ